MAQKSPSVRQAVAKYIRALQENGIRVQQVMLYGSHAKGTAHQDSDIDILVISEDFAGKSLLERLRVLALARWNVPEPVQPYGFTPQEVQNGELSAFWEEIIETQAVTITDEVLSAQA